MTTTRHKENVARHNSAVAHVARLTKHEPQPRECLYCHRVLSDREAAENAGTCDFCYTGEQ